MKNYQLNQNEIVLFRNNVTLQNENNSNNRVQAELLLTNENFVLITKLKKLFQKEIVNTVVVPFENMKIYNELPYMVRKGTLVEMYTLDAEYFLDFEKQKQAKEFFEKGMRVASGCSKFVRKVKNVSKEIKDTNDALGVDIVNTTKKVLNFAADVVLDYVERPKKGKVQLLGSVAKVFKKGKNQDGLQVETKRVEMKEELLLPSNNEDEN